MNVARPSSSIERFEFYFADLPRAFVELLGGRWVVRASDILGRRSVIEPLSSSARGRPLPRAFFNRFVAPQPSIAPRPRRIFRGQARQPIYRRRIIFAEVWHAKPKQRTPAPRSVRVFRRVRNRRAKPPPPFEVLVGLFQSNLGSPLRSPFQPAGLDQRGRIAGAGAPPPACSLPPPNERDPDECTAPTASCSSRIYGRYTFSQPCHHRGAAFCRARSAFSSPLFLVRASSIPRSVTPIVRPARGALPMPGSGCSSSTP